MEDGARPFLCADRTCIAQVDGAALDVDIAELVEVAFVASRFDRRDDMLRRCVGNAPVLQSH